MSVGSEDLGWALSSLAGFLLVIAGIAAVIAWAGRREGGWLTVVRATRALAIGWVVLGLVALPIVVVRAFAESETVITNLSAHVDWPGQLSCGEPVTHQGATLTCASINEVTATITGLGFAPRAMLGLGQVLGLILLVVPGVALAVICVQMLRRAPFSPVVGRTLFASAIVVLICGLSAEVVSGIGRGLAAAEVLPPYSSDSLSVSAGGFLLNLPLWPIGAALALTALGAVFRHGAVLQRDTERLV